MKKTNHHVFFLKNMAILIRDKQLSRIAGITFTEFMVAVGISLFIILLTMRSLSNHTGVINNVDDQIERENLKFFLPEQIDCDRTFLINGINPLDPAACNTTNYFRLQQRNNTGINQWLTPPLLADQSALYSGWSIRASCDTNNGSMVIRVAKKDRTEVVKFSGHKLCASEFELNRGFITQS